MRITAREAARLLAPAGLPRHQARLLLASGLAGPGEQVGRAHLYEAARVEALRDAASVSLPAHATRVVVARLGAGRRWRADLPVARQREIAAGPWLVTALNRLEVRLSAPLPFLATVAGYVVLAADVLDVRAVRAEQSRFILRHDADWARDAVGTRCPTGPGPSWLLLPATALS